MQTCDCHSAAKEEVERVWKIHNEFLSGPYHQLQASVHDLRNELNALEAENKNVKLNLMAISQANLQRQELASKLNDELSALKKENTELIDAIVEAIDRYDYADPYSEVIGDLWEMMEQKFGVKFEDKLKARERLRKQQLSTTEGD